MPRLTQRLLQSLVLNLLVPSFNPKMQTLVENAMSFAGPFNSEMEMQININNKKRERRQWQTTNT